VQLDAGPPPNQVPFTATPPTIDGDVQGAEWAGAWTCTTTALSGTLTFHLLADATALYVAGTTDDADYANSDTNAFTADVDLNGGDPDTPDRSFRISRQNGAVEALEGSNRNDDGSGFLNTTATSATGARVDNTSDWEFELSIPRSELHATTLRFAFENLNNANTPPTSVCPTGADAKSISTWLELPLP
jgi:hypothetical protein